ncbi:MAG: rRNA pseudouridine synthase [Clostridia bacterium]|nr:rRNA pseudouridine synthase [Clostridia bacterium]
MRLDKYLSNMGLGSRKDVRGIIGSGAVTVDGQIVKNADAKIQEGISDVQVNGQSVAYKPYVYLMLYKPAGYLSATEDGRGGPVATDLIGDDYNFYDLGPAGRLDKDAEGFLLLTNDGPFVHRIITPEKHVEKQYFVRLRKDITEADKVAFREGIRFKDGTLCRPAQLEAGEEPATAFVTIHEGKFHQVKKMFLARDNEVVYLKRISIGGIALDETLEPGEYRELTQAELEPLL